MRYIATVVVLSLFAVPAMAQGLPTPSQTAIQIDNVINQWAQVIEAQQKTIEQLKEKCGEPCKDIK